MHALILNNLDLISTLPVGHLSKKLRKCIRFSRYKYKSFQQAIYDNEHYPKDL